MAAAIRFEQVKTGSEKGINGNYTWCLKLDNGGDEEIKRGSEWLYPIGLRAPDN